MAARRITNSLSPFLWSGGNPAHKGHRVQENKKWGSVLVGIQALGWGQPGRCGASMWGLWVGGQCWPRPGAASPEQPGGGGVWGCGRAVPAEGADPSHVPALARDILRYFSLFGAPSLAPAVAMAKAEAADRALRVLSSSRHEVTTTPLL